VLVISGEVDPGSPPAAAAIIANTIPGASQVVIPGASHIAVVEEPLQLAKTIVAFLER
jgi:pimeloyl-ACP methyl ester carboxylesterase